MSKNKKNHGGPKPATSNQIEAAKLTQEQKRRIDCLVELVKQERRWAETQVHLSNTKIEGWQREIEEAQSENQTLWLNVGLDPKSEMVLMDPETQEWVVKKKPNP